MCLYLLYRYPIDGLRTWNGSKPCAAHCVIIKSICAGLVSPWPIISMAVLRDQYITDNYGLRRLILTRGLGWPVYEKSVGIGCKPVQEEDIQVWALSIRLLCFNVKPSIISPQE